MYPYVFTRYFKKVFNVKKVKNLCPVRYGKCSNLRTIDYSYSQSNIKRNLTKNNKETYFLPCSPAGKLSLTYCTAGYITTAPDPPSRISKPSYRPWKSNAKRNLIIKGIISYLVLQLVSYLWHIALHVVHDHLWSHPYWPILKRVNTLLLIFGHLRLRCPNNRQKHEIPNHPSILPTHFQSWK